jgi:DNA primase
MSFDQTFLQDLKERAGLVDVIVRRVKLAPKGREFSGLCPFHQEMTPSFFVVPDKGFFHCHGCAAHGDVIAFVMRSENLDFIEAVERLAAQAGIELPRQTPLDRQIAAQQKTLLAALAAAANFYERQLWAPIGAPGRDYLTGRGLDAGTIRRFRLGYAGDDRAALRRELGCEFSPSLLIDAGLLHRSHYARGDHFDFFQRRVIFPIADRLGRIIAFSGRTLGYSQPKYLNSPEHPLFDKGRTLYGLSAARGNLARDEAIGGAIVAEGQMDVIALQRAGFGGAVAPLGTALTERHLRELWRLDPEPTLCFDGDPAGQRAALRTAHRALPMLRPGQSLRFIRLPADHDPDMLIRQGGPGAFNDSLQGALPLAEVLWRSELAVAPIDTPERRAGLIQRVMARAATIGDPVVREEYRLFLRRQLAELRSGPGVGDNDISDARGAIEAGRASDNLSREAFHAWRQRWWRAEDGRDRRLDHYASAALGQVRQSAPRLAIMPLGAARGVTPSKAGAHWHAGEPKRDHWLATLPIFEAAGNALVAIELLAWYPDEPQKFWRRTGACRVLGRARLDTALREGKPLRVYRTPQSWNRAGGGAAPGCCILDWDSSEGLECRAFARALVGDDRAHARELQRLLDRRRPRVQFVIGGK